MSEELKDKLDAQEIIEELCEKYSEYVNDLVQEEGDAVKSKAMSAAKEYFKK